MYLEAISLNCHHLYSLVPLFALRLKNVERIASGDQQRRWSLHACASNPIGQSRFFIGAVAMVIFIRIVAIIIRTTMTQKEYIVDFSAYWLCLLAQLVSRNHLGSPSDCLRLLSREPDAVTHPIKRSGLLFLGLLLLVRSCSSPQGKCKRSIGRCVFCLIFVSSDFDKFRPLKYGYISYIGNKSSRSFLQEKKK